jgi:Rrf2 family protein
MSYLARHSEALSTTAEIAAAERIPPKYLEGIMTHLKASGFIDGERGKHGGYRLQVQPQTISMLSIIEAMDGSVMPVSCVGLPGACEQGKSCLPRQFWIGLKGAIDDYLRTKTLKDVTEGATHE